MPQIIEVNEEGAIYLPPDLLVKVLGDAGPHTRYLLEAQDGKLVLTRIERVQPFWTTATPKERAKAFRRWATKHKQGPGLPDDALHRENMYALGTSPGGAA